jgi:hypothetical protein
LTRSGRRKRKEVAANNIFDEAGMASEPGRRLFDLTEALTGSAPSGSGDIAKLTNQLSELVRLTADQGNALQENTRAVQENSVMHVDGRIGSAVTNIAKGFGSKLLSGNPLFSGIAGLFGGGDTASSNDSFTKYLRPERRDLEVGLTSVRQNSDATRPAGLASGQGNSIHRPTNTAPQVIVNVNALDTRSFLDHSGEIAKALREAVLNSTTVSDVMNEW